MPAANAFTLIRQNVQTILAWSELLAVVAAEDMQTHERDVDVRGVDGEGEITGRSIDLRISQRSFTRDSSSSWRFSLRFTARVNASRLPVGKLEEIEWLILRAATFLDAGVVPGTTTPLTAVTPAIVDEYVVAELVPDIDLNSVFEDGWESVIAIVVNGTIPYAALVAA